MKVIQITDTHLFANDDAEMLGVKSNVRFQEVLAKIIAEDKHDTDMFILTGDVSQDETAQSYQKIADELMKFALPVYWIPGNHDDILQMEAVLNNAKHFSRLQHLSSPHWEFIFLNTKKDGTPDGFLSVQELQLLSDKINAVTDNKNIVVIMHHHPAPVGTPLIDNYILKNQSDFWNIVTDTNVKLIICGHVHGDYRFKHNDIMIESCPATCLQWQKGTTDLKFDTEIGYKIYHFDDLSYQSIVKMWQSQDD